MVNKEAMKLALEALKRMKRYGNTFGYRSQEQNPYEQVCEAIIALEALAEQPAQQEPVAFEPAPNNSLPTWDECALRVANSELIAKRVAEGGYGPDHDSKLASALHRFIHEYDDADPYRSGWFLHRLEQVVNECTPPPAERKPVPPSAYESLLRDMTTIAAREVPNGCLVAEFAQHALADAELREHDAPAQRKPLTNEQREEIAKGWRGRNWTVGDIIDATESAHGIKENT